jgi:hypothetical protein
VAVTIGSVTTSIWGNTLYSEKILKQTFDPGSPNLGVRCYIWHTL